MSLRYRIAVVIFLLEAVMMAAVLWGTLGYAVNAAHEQIDAAEKVTLDIVSGIGHVALLNEDYDRIQGYIEALPKNPGITKAMLSDDRNIIVASSNLADLGEYMPKLKDGEALHWRTENIRNVSGDQGLLAVQFSEEARIKNYDDAMQRGISIAAAGMSLIAIVGIGIGVLLTSRLQRLSQVAEQVSQGNYKIRADLNGRDEMAHVGAAFDTMTETIASERQALAAANTELEARVKDRTLALEQSNQEHKAFTHAISHDLRAPLRTLCGFSQALNEDYAGQLDETAKQYLQRISSGALRMSELIDGLLKLSRINQADIDDEPVDFSNLCNELVDELREQYPERDISIDIQPGVTARGDKHLLRDAMVNLIGNAWKFTARTPQAEIAIGTQVKNDNTTFFIRDNGAGFDPEMADNLFTPFQRLHSNDDFPGTGIGLSTVQRIIHRHDGTLWATADTGKGATFYFTLHSQPPEGEHVSIQPT